MSQLTTQELNWLATLQIGQLVTVEPFSNGLTNQVFLLTTARDLQYIFKRLNQQARTQQDRQSELLVQQLASENKLSPKVLADCQQYRLQEYIKGECLERLTIDKQSLELLATQLHIIHQLPALHAPKQRLAEELRQLKKRLMCPIEQCKFEYFLQLARQLDKSSGADILCHGDLSFSNLLQTENLQIKVLDWEYAVLGCAAYDLAACCAINRLNRAQQTQLVHHYYQLNQQNLSLSLVECNNQTALYRKVFTYLNQLWASCF